MSEQFTPPVDLFVGRDNIVGLFEGNPPKEGDYVFSGPRGAGKTRLLLALQELLQERQDDGEESLIVGQITISNLEDRDFQNVLRKIEDEYDIGYNLGEESGLSPGKEFAREIISRLDEHTAGQLFFLVDFDGRVRKGIYSRIKKFLDDIRDEFHKNFIPSQKNIFHVFSIIVGQNITRFEEDLAVAPLEPLSIDEVREIVQVVFNQFDFDAQNLERTTTLLHCLTGGYPGAVFSMLQEIGEDIGDIGMFFNQEREEDLWDGNEIRQIIISLLDYFRQSHRTIPINFLERISVFRYFHTEMFVDDFETPFGHFSLMKNLKQSGFIFNNTIRDQYQSYSCHGGDSVFCNFYYRVLLKQQVRQDNLVELEEIINDAIQKCGQYIVEEHNNFRVWAIEYIYQKVQLRVFLPLAVSEEIDVWLNGICDDILMFLQRIPRSDIVEEGEFLDMFQSLINSLENDRMENWELDKMLGFLEERIQSENSLYERLVEIFKERTI